MEIWLPFGINTHTNEWFWLQSFFEHTIQEQRIEHISDHAVLLRDKLLWLNQKDGWSTLYVYNGDHPHYQWSVSDLGPVCGLHTYSDHQLVIVEQHSDTTVATIYDANSGVRHSKPLTINSTTFQLLELADGRLWLQTKEQAASIFC